MRLVFRLLGLLLLAGAFAAMIVDGTRSVAAGTTAILSLGDTIGRVAPDGLQKLRHVVETKMPMLWDPVLVTILLMPTWVVLGAAGLLLLVLTRARPPMIGYSRR